MKITILNKNRINNTGSYELSNLLSFEIDEGFTITENFNETLNSATIRLSHLTSEIDIDNFDEVILTGDTRFNDLYFCVDDYECIEESLDTGNKTYTYEITLFSQIKLLEGIILPNLSITPLKSPENKRSVYDYLSLYLNEYGEKIRVNNSWVKRYDFSQNVIDRFSAIICPELQWNAPTLREVLNDLTMVDNCVLTLNNGVLDILDLEQTTGREITNYNYVRKSKSSTDYVSDIRMNLQNALQTSADGVSGGIIVGEYIPFTSNDYTFTSDNMLVKTQHPILRVKSFKILTFFADFPYRYAYIKDLTNIDGYSLIKEYNEYSTLPILRTTGNYDPTKTGEYYSQYQNYCIFYTRGTNEISGFTNISKKYSSLGFSWQTIDWLEMITMGGAVNQDRAIHYFDMFYIEYETTATQTFSAGKGDKQDNYRVIVDNQTNSWVDVNTQSKLEYSKANRLGNESLLINQRYKNSGDLMKIGDKLRDNIVYQTQYQVYSDLVNANGLATKNYILKDFFTGINRKIRTWVNAKDEAFERHDLIKYYCELSLNRRNEYYIDTYNQRKYFLSPLYSNTIDPIKYATITTTTEEVKTFLVHPIVKPATNSLILTCGFDDNAVAGKYYDVNSIVSDGQTMEGMSISSDDLVDRLILFNNHFYVDENYEVANFDIAFGTTTTFDNDVIMEMAETGQYELGIDNMIDPLLKRLHLPLVESNTITKKFGEIVNLMKDNKEIPQFSFQYEFCCENRDIYFTNLFVLLQEAVRTKLMTQIKVYGSNTYTYGKLVITNEIEQVNATITTTDSGEVNITNVDDYEAYYITDNNNNIIIGVKSATFYLNILKYRNKNIYNNNKEKIGEI